MKEKVQQIWAYVLHIRQKKRSNGRMLEIMGVSRILCKLKNAVQIEQIYSKGAARKSAVPFAVILAVNLPYVKDQ